MFESSEKALQREIAEEFGEIPIIGKLLWTTETMFYLEAWKGEVHELAFYYAFTFPKGSSIYSKDYGNGTEKLPNGQPKLSYKWFDISDLNQIRLYPIFLRDGIKNLPQCPTHLIINELESDVKGVAR